MNACATYCPPEQGLDQRWVAYALRRISAIACGETPIDAREKIFIRGVSRSSFEKIISLPPGQLEWIPTRSLLPPGMGADLPSTMPILFRTNAVGGPPVEELDGRLYFNVDLIAATFFMLSRWEEAISTEQDRHRRFPHRESVAYRQRYLERPIVDEYGLIIRSWVKHFFPAWLPPRNNFQVKLSHDVDFIAKYPSLRHVLRAVKRDLRSNHNLLSAVKTGRAGFLGLIDRKNDGYIDTLRRLMALSERNDLKSAFYFMGATRSAFDDGYDVRQFKSIIQEIINRGHEVGFHPGYGTYNDPQLLKKEKRRIVKVLGMSPLGGRQHYLRFKVPDTWRHWENCGMTYDSSMGYVGHEGFRCGTCHPFAPYDLEYDREIDIMEIPLIVMDKTLRSPGCRGLTPEEGKDRILYYAECCQKMGGVFTLLWHNTSLGCDGEPWASVYEAVLPILAKLQSGGSC